MNLQSKLKNKKTYTKKEIIFTSKLENASTLNSQFDAFYSPQNMRNAPPLSDLKALLFEVSVVATSVGVVPEIINNGTNGFIATVKDVNENLKPISK